MKRLKTVLFLLLVAKFMFAQHKSIETPEWAKDLVVYEISTKNFTSPNGPGTGTFNSLKEKIPYVSELGANAVWLTGHNWADNDHFYNIWTQYATFRPDSIEPSLGTPQEFKALIDEFHKYGIKVFLDVITHGVMDDSPMIKEHPEWFRGGSWGMTDFDWYGNHPDLDKWWVKTFTDYVTKYGIDGYRLDVMIYRPDLWNQINDNAGKAGHPIVIFNEGKEYCEGVTDFYQRLTQLADQQKGLLEDLELLDNVASFYNDFYDNKTMFNIDLIRIVYTDESEDYYNKTKSTGNLKFEVVSPKEPISIKELDGKKNIKIKIENINPEKGIKTIFAYPKKYWHISYNIGEVEPAKHFVQNFPVTLHNLSTLTIGLTPFKPDEILLSLQLSCHDDGWKGFPAESNPYVAEGSRCVFGYSFMFTPAVLFFMSGDEFDAEFVANPMLSPDLFGKSGTPGEGKWLYGAVIQWEQIEKDNHKAMLEDVKQMIAIRKQEKDIFHAYSSLDRPNILELEYECDTKIPVPYTIQNDDKIIIVAGNNTNDDVNCTIKLSLETVGLKSNKTYKVYDLWEDKEFSLKGKDLANFTFEIKKDKVATGGLRVFKIEK